MELVRAFGEPSARETPGDTAQETDRYAARLTESQHEIAVLQERLRAVERERDHLAAVVAEAQERERWLRGQLEAQTRLQLANTGGGGGLWHRLFGRSPPGNSGGQAS